MELGLTPRVPPTPPALVCPPSYKGILPAAVAGLLGIVVTVVTTQVWALVVTLGLFGLIIVRVVIMQRRERLEVAAGYRLVNWRAGTWGRDPDRRFTVGTGMAAAPWDLRGLWFLDEKGQVLAPPDPSVLPPGKYPSPNKPGQLEMWTGTAWMYGYETPREPFL